MPIDSTGVWVYDSNCVNAGGGRCDYPPEDCRCEEFDDGDYLGYSDEDMGW